MGRKGPRRWIAGDLPDVRHELPFGQRAGCPRVDGSVARTPAVLVAEQSPEPQAHVTRADDPDVVTGRDVGRDLLDERPEPVKPFARDAVLGNAAATVADSRIVPDVTCRAVSRRHLRDHPLDPGGALPADDEGLVAVDPDERRGDLAPLRPGASASAHDSAQAGRPSLSARSP